MICNLEYRQEGIIANNVFFSASLLTVLLVELGLADGKITLLYWAGSATEWVEL